jgi:propanol-preferring alcohol dehydrogenase
MAKMRAVQVSVPGGELELVERGIPEPKENEALIKVAACGICHGDAVVKAGHFRGVSYPRIPGHEVIGILEKLGREVEGWKEGQRVGVGWPGGHCGTCAACRRGQFFACENSVTTGISTDGGYTEYMTARREALIRIPDELSSVEDAPLLCAGRTTFGALRNSGARAGDLVAVLGLGGLGHLAVQYAAKMGFRTIAVSRGKEKEELARKLGAHVYIDASAGDAARRLSELGGARVILCTAPSGKAISEVLGGLCPNGQTIIVVAVGDPIIIPPLPSPQRRALHQRFG